VTEVPGELGVAQRNETKTDAPGRWLGERCAWCGIHAGAVPDQPPVERDGKWYHRVGCASAALMVDRGLLPADYEPWGGRAS